MAQSLNFNMQLNEVWPFSNRKLFRAVRFTLEINLF